MLYNGEKDKDIIQEFWHTTRQHYLYQKPKKPKTPTYPRGPVRHLTREGIFINILLTNPKLFNKFLNFRWITIQAIWNQYNSFSTIYVEELENKVIELINHYSK